MLHLAGRLASMLLSGLAVTCAGARAPTPLPPSGAGEAAPWEIPALHLGRQHLFRLSYRGPEASAGLKVALRLVSPDAFTVRVFDRLGRPVWAATSRGGETLVVDHERESHCRVRGPVPWAGLRELGALAPGALPALLLGRVPRPPAAPAGVGWGETFRYRDARGGTWTGSLAGETVSSWILYEGGEPSWWWNREDGGGILSQRGAGRQIRWQPVAREDLAPAPELTPPAGYRESCDAVLHH